MDINTDHGYLLQDQRPRYCPWQQPGLDIIIVAVGGKQNCLRSNNGRSRGSRWNAGFQRLPTPHLSPSLLSASFHSTRTVRSLYYFQFSATYVLIERGHISTAPQSSGRVPGYLAACLGLEDPGWLSCCWPARKKA